MSIYVKFDSGGHVFGLYPWEIEERDVRFSNSDVFQDKNVEDE